jgi:hypothetical protein
MNTNWTYVLGALQIAFGLIGFVTQWVDSTVAMTLIINGAAVFGLTRQNVKLGRALGAKI